MTVHDAVLYGPDRDVIDADRLHEWIARIRELRAWTEHYLTGRDCGQRGESGERDPDHPARTRSPLLERETMNEIDRTIEDLMPTETPSRIAWLGAVHYACGSKDMLEAYRRETGDGYKRPTTAIDRLIDDATGADLAFLRRFLTWFNTTIWGK